MNVHDWLANLPFSDPESSCRIVEVSFNQGSRKDFFRNTSLTLYEKGEIVSLEGVNGFDVGTISLTGELVRLQLKKRGVKEESPEIKKILRVATPMDMDKWKENKAREKEVLIRSRAIARQLNLDLKMAEVEIQADGKKATFFYIADERVDFRELIRVYASEFKVKVEMKQIGARQEAGKVGGIGSCGRELCCSTWLTDFKSVNTNAARYQNLSINQTKLSGQCGRLKCCLNYELDTYLDALQHFPDDSDVLEVTKGRAFLVKKDIFRNLMWYTMADTTKLYPLALDTVKKIKEQNKQGIKPDALETVDVTSNKFKEVEPEFVDVVGQLTLKTLEKSKNKRKENDRRKGPKSQSPATNHPNNQTRTNRPPEGRNKPSGERQSGHNSPKPNKPRPPQNNQGKRPQEGNKNSKGNGGSPNRGNGKSKSVRQNEPKS